MIKVRTLRAWLLLGMALGGVTWAACPPTPSCPGVLTVCIDIITPPGVLSVDSADLTQRYLPFAPNDPLLRVQRPGGGVTWTVTAEATSVSPASVPASALQIKDRNGLWQDGDSPVTVRQNSVDCEEFVVEHRLDLGDLGDRASGETLSFVVTYTVTE